MENLKPILPSKKEITLNPASRSAKLRYAIKIEENNNFREIFDKFNYYISVHHISFERIL